MDFLRNRTQQEHFALWFKDYTPESMAEIIGNTDLVDTLRLYIEVGHIPDILLSGPNGTTKKNIARLVAKEYLGGHYEYGHIEIDGSISRGKDNVTNTNDYKKISTDKLNSEGKNIMTFAKAKISLGGKKKVVIIYNFDYMTIEAQNAMRRVIELYAKTTRFIFVCNDIDKIIEPIQSRCVPLQTSYLLEKEIIQAMKQVLTKAGFSPDHVDHNVLKTICMLSGGDLKKAINYLQVISSSPEPNLDTLYKIFNIPPVHNIIKILDAVSSPTTYQIAYDTLDKLLENGYNSSDILSIFIPTVISYDIDLKTKTDYLHALSRCSVKTELAKTNSNLFSLIARLGKIRTDGYEADSI